MVLLVTTLLSLVTMFDTVSNNSPDALELKCIEVGSNVHDGGKDREEGVYNSSTLRRFRLPGLVNIVHIIRVPRTDGVLYRAVRNSLR